MAASEHPDAWLWVAMLAVGYYAAYRIYPRLEQFREAVEITKSESRPRLARVDQATEDAVKLETLGQLAKSPSIGIREASIRILKDRLIKPGEAWDLLLEHLSSSRSSRRNKAIIILDSLLPQKSPFPQCLEHPFWQSDFHSSFLSCLRNQLPSTRQAFGKKQLPAMSQRNTLKILYRMLYHNPEENIQRLLDAGLIRDWLVHYPLCPEYRLGGPLPPPKAEVVKKLVLEEKDEDSEPCHTWTFRAILQSLVAERSGARQHMIEASLWSSAFEGRKQMLRKQTSRFEESPEEMQLRRRRRQAVVIGEEGRPIQRSDIIQSGDEAVDEDIEERLEQLFEEEVAAGRGNGAIGSFWSTMRRLRPDGLAAR